MKRIFEQIFQRPFKAFVSSLELLAERAWTRQKVDGVISRFIHLINRPQVLNEEELLSAKAQSFGASEKDGADESKTLSDESFIVSNLRDEISNEDLSGINALRVSREENQNFKERKKMDRDLHDDMLKLVRYKVLFVKREYEHAFEEQEDLVSENMEGTAFTAWKIAEFIQKLSDLDTRVPEKWANYPQNREHKIYWKEVETNGRKQKYLLGLPDEDKKYLRIYHEVLDRYPREKFKYEEQQIDVLREIRDEIRDNNNP